MKVRGRRECRDCGSRWSYYETGSVACPDCGSLHSVGLDDDRRLYTGTAAELDLTAARAATDESLRRATDLATDAAREFIRRRGFVAGGTLQPLDDRFLAAAELRHVAARLGRAIRVPDDEELYFLSLLAADEGERPPPDAVPEAVRAARGRGVADAVEAYGADVRAYLDEHPDELAVGLLGTIRQYVNRVQALEGDVPPTEAERLAAAAGDLGRYLRTGEEAAVSTARERLRAIRE